MEKGITSNSGELAEKYIGYYTYDKSYLNAAIGPVSFVITIYSVKGTKFKGTVQDEEKGIPGTGTVAGEFNGTKISFIKRNEADIGVLPNGKKIAIGAKPSKIFYKGELTEGQYRGKWEIKSSIRFVGLVPFISIYTSGTWEMWKEEN